MPVAARPVVRPPVEIARGHGAPLMLAVGLVLGAGMVPAKPQGALAVAQDSLGLAAVIVVLLAAVTYAGHLVTLAYRGPGQAPGSFGSGCMRWSRTATWMLLAVAILRAAVVTAALLWS